MQRSDWSAILDKQIADVLISFIFREPNQAMRGIVNDGGAGRSANNSVSRLLN